MSNECSKGRNYVIVLTPYKIKMSFIGLILKFEGVLYFLSFWTYYIDADLYLLEFSNPCLEVGEITFHWLIDIIWSTVYFILWSNSIKFRN